MALIVDHLQDKKSVYLQDKDGNEVEFIRASDFKPLVEKMLYTLCEDHFGRGCQCCREWSEIMFELEALLKEGE